ncbi:MAG: hypothetical protein RR365_11050 [Bacteroides sp.]
MIELLEKAIKLMFVGDAGIKTVKHADETIYERTGGFFYLALNTLNKK